MTQPLVPFTLFGKTYCWDVIDGRHTLVRVPEREVELAEEWQRDPGGMVHRAHTQLVESGVLG